MESYLTLLSSTVKLDSSAAAAEEQAAAEEEPPNTAAANAPPPKTKSLVRIGKRKRFSFVSASQPAAAEEEPVEAAEEQAAAEETEPASKLSLTCWLSGNQIENHLEKIAGINSYALPHELATSIILHGKSSLRKRLLSKFRFLYGAILQKNHWMTLFVDIENRSFYFIDSFGTTIR